jgi:hypothetical protein
MSYIDKDPNNQELLAELLLSVYYPNVKSWNASYGSFFSRNYSGDLRSVHADTNTVTLSRNGLYDILPEKMFFDVEELRFKESRDLAQRIEEIYEEEKNIQDFFMPLDSFFFNQSCKYHAKAAELLNNKEKWLLKLLFDYDIDAEENPYVKQIAPLLLHVTEIRADLNLIAQILSELLNCKVDYQVNHQNEVIFVVHKWNLSCEEYCAFVKEIKPLFDFVAYWFVSMEMDCIYKVKDYHQPFILSTELPLVLDYNTQI